MANHSIGNVEVELQSMNDIERGLREDMSLIWSYMNFIRTEMADLGKVWQNADHDAFINRYEEEQEHLNRSLDSLDELVKAYNTSLGYYTQLERKIAELKAKL